MVEPSLAFIMVVAIARIARADDKSPIIWAVIAIVFSLLCMNYIHFPYARILLAGFLSFGAMIAYNYLAKK